MKYRFFYILFLPVSAILFFAIWGHSQVSCNLNNLNFGFRIFEKLEDKEEKEKTNICFSPWSTAQLLSYLASGARGNTQYAIVQTVFRKDVSSQLLNNVFRSKFSDPDKLFYCANSLYYPEGLEINTEFQRLSKDFNTELYPLNISDFSDFHDKNISQLAKSKIYGNFSRFSPKARSNHNMMYLVSSSRFHQEFGELENDGILTERGTFRYLDGNDFAAVELPCKNDFCTVIFARKIQDAKNPVEGFLLPVKKIISNVKFAKFSSRQFREKNLKDLVSGDFNYVNGEVSVPKFQTVMTEDLSDILSNSGLSLAFSQPADFSEINSSGILRISNFWHLASFQLKEKIKQNNDQNNSNDQQQINQTNNNYFQWNIKEPFIFVSYDKNSKNILFMGKIVKSHL